MSEHKCVVSVCCCGCSLRSGSMAIGIISLIMSILGAIGGIYYALNESAEGWFNFVLNVICLILSALLIQGIRQERRGFVMAWVWGMVILVILQIISAIIIIATTANLSLAISTIIVMGICIYLIIVVRSYGLSLAASPTMA